MTEHLNESFDVELIEALRLRARAGASVKDLAELMADRLGSEDAIIPMLGYLCRAFWVPLPVLLPFREDRGKGDFSRALQVVLWFSSLVSEGCDVLPWSWDDFQRLCGREFPNNASPAGRDDAGEILRYWQPPNHPGVLVARGMIELNVDKVEALGTSSAELFQAVKRFTTRLRDLLSANRKVVDGAAKVAAALRMEFQIDEQGPMYRVICRVYVLKNDLTPAALQLA